MKSTIGEGDNNFTPSVCACNKCVNMCKTAPCLGTPQDILNLIEAGYKDRLSITMWRAFANVEPVILFTSLTDDNGHCTFLKNGLCELHDKGLKPTEGQLANHALVAFNLYQSPTWHVVKQWHTAANHEIEKKILSHFEKGLSHV